ncbi:MAG: sodium-dependent transporter [Thermoanaerobaculia bacterium]
MSEPAGSAGRERFGTRLGFVLAAAGSAVGLGNMWRFPYQAAEGGGAAFVVLYVCLTFLIGVPVMAGEFALGRRTGSSPARALRAVGGSWWTPLGLLFVMTPLLILAYFSVVSGWTLRYALDALCGVSAPSAERFAEVSTGAAAIRYHLIVMGVTVGIVMGGIRKGIERAGLILMPTLFALLLALAIWAMTLDGSGPGYAFYLRPSISALLDPVVFQQAASQACLSLSIGMGVMITYGSYAPRRTDIGQQAVTVSLSDFSVAFIGGMVVFPVIFALGLSDQVGASTMGALFISLPGAFAEMGVAGRYVGVAFFVALLVAGVTSLISLLEVVTASLIDELGMRRRSATLAAGALAAAVGVLPALSQDALAVLDQLAGELLVILGALGICVLVGWRMKRPVEELRAGASAFFARVAPGPVLLLRWVVPPVLLVILWLSVRRFVALVGG